MPFLRISLLLWALFPLASMAENGQVLSNVSGMRLLMQSSPLAGSQFYALGRLRAEIRVGDALTLAREPENPYDPQAVRVEWHGEKLGYVPRRENRAVARALEYGDPLQARVSRLLDDADPWKRLEFEIWMVIQEAPPQIGPRREDWENVRINRPEKSGPTRH